MSEFNTWPECVNCHKEFPYGEMVWWPDNRGRWCYPCLKNGGFLEQGTHELHLVKFVEPSDPATQDHIGEWE